MFGLRMEPISKEAKMPLSKIHNTTISDIPLWTIKIPEINLNLNKHRKTGTHPLNLREKFEKIKESYTEYLYFLTEESKYKKQQDLLQYVTGNRKKAPSKRNFILQRTDLRNRLLL